MLSRNTPLVSFVRKRLFPSHQLRYQITTNQSKTRLQNQPKTCLSRRRYLSSDKEKGDPALEECARSITRALGNQNADGSLEPAVELARKLSPEARREIMQASSSTKASTTEASAAAILEAEVPPPSYHDLRLVALAQAIPFLGFGFMDNAILIIAGDAIDTSLGKPIWPGS